MIVLHLTKLKKWAAPNMTKITYYEVITGITDLTRVPAEW